jgi:glutaminyl-peptide cyclotransferase
MRNAYSLRIIIISGLLIFALMMVISGGLRKALQPNPAQQVQLAGAASPFDGGRAFEDVRALIALGPRPAGSEALARASVYVTGQLRAAGLEVSTQEVPVPGAPPLLMVVGKVRGNSGSSMVLCSHYDTFASEAIASPGANVGTSGAAVLLELARTFGGQREGDSIWFCFWGGTGGDPEDPARVRACFAFLEELRNRPDFGPVRASLFVEAVGDCYLGIQRDPEAPRWLHETIWEVAEQLGYGRHFLAAGDSLMGAHLALRQARWPMLHLIDARFGGSLVQHRALWNTEQDTLERVCPGSLQAVGDVIYHGLLAAEPDPSLPR